MAVLLAEAPGVEVLTALALEEALLAAAVADTGESRLPLAGVLVVARHLQAAAVADPEEASLLVVAVPTAGVLAAARHLLVAAAPMAVELAKAVVAKGQLPRLAKAAINIS